MHAFQCVHVIFITAVQLETIYQIGCCQQIPSWQARLLRHCRWTGFFKKHMFNVLIRNNEKFDLNLHHTTFLMNFFNIFFEKME